MEGISRIFFILSICCFCACVFFKDDTLALSSRYILFGFAFLIIGFVLKAKNDD